jgi:hypothetical protein
VCGEATYIGITLLFEGLWIHVNQLPASLSLPCGSGVENHQSHRERLQALLLLDQRFVAIECYQASLIESFDQAGGACKITRVFDMRPAFYPPGWCRQDPYLGSSLSTRFEAMIRILINLSGGLC